MVAVLLGFRIEVIHVPFQLSGITRLCIDRFITLERNLNALSPSFFIMSIDRPSDPRAFDGLALVMVFATAVCMNCYFCRSLCRFFQNRLSGIYSRWSKGYQWSTKTITTKSGISRSSKSLLRFRKHIYIISFERRVKMKLQIKIPYLYIRTY